MYSITDEELVGKPINFERSSKTPPEVFAEILPATLKGGWQGEIWNCRKDGSEFPIYLSTSIVRNNHGEPIALVGLSVDIAERKKAEDQLHTLSSAVEQSSVSIIITNPKGEIEYVNKKFTDVSGYLREEVIGKDSNILSSGNVSTDEYSTMWETVLAGKEWTGLFHNKKKNGELFWVSASISPILNDDGAITHLLAVEEDITEKMIAEEKILEQATLLDNAHDAIAIVDLEFRLKYINKGTELLYGWTAQEVIGKKPFEFVYPNAEALAKRNTAVRELFANGVWSGELVQQRKNGTTIMVENRWTLLRDSNNIPKAILVINTDNTERNQLQRQLLRSQRLESLGTLAGGVAHDLNNVLTPILMSVEILRNDIPRERFQRLVDTIETSTLRGKNILQQMLTFARGADEDRRMLNPKHLLKEIEHLIGETFSRAITIQFSIAPDLKNIYSNATQIHQVLMNLCVNARDAMVNSGVLSVTAENMSVDTHFASLHIGAKEDEYICIHVSDTGTGIAADVMEKMFEPFFTTKEIGKGTGLGLSTVHSIIKGNGGFITFKSEIGKGTMFSIYLPAVEEQSNEAIAQSSDGMVEGNGETILLVDDEASMRDMTKDILEMHNYKILTAKDGNEALATFVQHKESITLIITDIMMPQMDGSTMMDMIWKIDKDIKIIAVSGLVEHSEIEKFVGRKAQEYISKPFKMHTLLTTVRKVLDIK